MQNNSTAARRRWVRKTLKEAFLNPDEKEELRTLGYRLVNQGYLRGDISDAWKRRMPGLHAGMVPDLYN